LDTLLDFSSSEDSYPEELGILLFTAVILRLTGVSASVSDVKLSLTDARLFVPLRLGLTGESYPLPEFPDDPNRYTSSILVMDDFLLGLIGVDVSSRDICCLLALWFSFRLGMLFPRGLLPGLIGVPVSLASSLLDEFD